MTVHEAVAIPSDTAGAPPARETRQFRAGFWAVAFAFLIVMAFGTLPSPLYGLYRTRDHLSAFMVTVIYAIFAVGTIGALGSVRFIATRAGRRGAMLGAVGTMIVAAGLLPAWKALPGVLVGRLITGVSVGLAAGTAITYLIELRARVDPSPVRRDPRPEHRHGGERRRPRHRSADRRRPGRVGEPSPDPAVPRVPGTRDHERAGDADRHGRGFLAAVRRLQMVEDVRRDDRDADHRARHSPGPSLLVGRAPGDFKFLIQLQQSEVIRRNLAEQA